MSLGISAIGWAAIAATVASTAVNYQNGQEQNKIAKKGIEQANLNALKLEKQATEDSNRVNQKKPDTSAILSAAMQSGRSGVSGTMLTGPQGVDPSTLQLGKNTLLGQ